MLGHSIADSLGQYTDLFSYSKTRNEVQGFESYQSLRLPKGLISDDTSLALSLADSIIANEYLFCPQDYRHRVTLWWFEGYNNCKSPYFKGKIKDLSDMSEKA